MQGGRQLLDVFLTQRHGEANRTGRWGGRSGFPTFGLDGVDVVRRKSFVGRGRGGHQGRREERSGLHVVFVGGCCWG